MKIYLSVATSLALLAAPAHAAVFKHKPYVQNATASQATLMWSQDTGGASISYGPKGGAASPLSEPMSADGSHEVTLAGLQPGARYAFSIALAGGGTEAGEFSTAAPVAQPFSFLLFGGNRNNDAEHQTVVNALAAQSGDFVLNTGDAVELPLAAQWDTFFGIEASLLSKNVSFMTLGNNEYSSGLGVPLWKTLFANPTASSGTESYYSFDWGNSRFAVLDFNLATATQTPWLDGVLADGRAKKLEHLFVVMHHGPYDSGSHGENTKAQAEWVPVLQKYGVDIVLSGHDYDYERGFNAATGLRYVVSGGGGAPLNGTATPGGYTQVFASTYHYVKFDVNGPNVSVTARKPDGTVIDTFAWTTAIAVDGGMDALDGGDAGVGSDVPADRATDAFDGGDSAASTDALGADAVDSPLADGAVGEGRTDANEMEARSDGPGRVDGIGEAEVGGDANQMDGIVEAEVGADANSSEGGDTGGPMDARADAKDAGTGRDGKDGGTPKPGGSNGCGCSSVPHGPSGTVFTLVVALAAFSRARRRSKRRHSCDAN